MFFVGTTKKMPNRRFEKPEVYAYMSTMKTRLATTRFNDKTWVENQRFLHQSKEDGTLTEKTKCIYPCSVVIGGNVPITTNLMVLEMNNEQNRIMGIGLIKNQIPSYNKYKVYEMDKYNTYTYMGGYHIYREEVSEEEEQTMKILEQLCFRGRRHQKRLLGIRLFPCDILYDYREQHENDLIVEVTQMFKRRFHKNPEN